MKIGTLSSIMYTIRTKRYIYFRKSNYLLLSRINILNVKITIRQQKAVELTQPATDSKKEANAGAIQIFVKNLKNIGFSVGMMR